MNKNCFRLIFNAARGQLMAVGEIATSHGKDSHGRSGTGAGHGARAATLATITFSIWCALGWVSWTPDAAAQVVADPAAPRKQQPIVLNTGNGVPLVQIQTPSNGGVSRNTYSQFDVGQAGVVLNNSRTDAPTQQGGWVQGNPWLAKGTARVILNEVNASNPSQLKGYVEVAGSRAEVIIANPAGIQVDGGGFINASGVTLSTGTALLGEAGITGWQVRGGNIMITGRGLDTSTADYTNLIARAVQVNAGLWAQQLDVKAGAEAGSDSTRPQFAIDVGQLGGMYAGKISLVGTEAGVGVRNAGVIAATAGDVVLQSDGWLTSSGGLQASGNLQLDVGSATLGGAQLAGGNASLNAAQAVELTGVLGAAGQVRVKAGSLDAAGSATLAAGLQADGTLGGNAELNLTTTGAANLHGQALASGAASISAAGIDLSKAQVGAASLDLQSAAGIDTSQATVAARGNLTLQAAGQVNNQGGALSADSLRLASQGLDNQQGQILATGSAGSTLDAGTGTMDNRAGRIGANANDLSLQAGSLLNQGGRIEHAGSGQLGVQAQGDLHLAGGQLSSNGRLQLQAGGAIDHQGASTTARELSLQARSLDNTHGQLFSAQDAQLVVQQQLDNTDGSLRASGALDIGAATLDNTRGSVYASSDLRVQASGAVDNSGLLAAQGHVQVHAGSLQSTGILAAGLQADGQLASAMAGSRLEMSAQDTLRASGQQLASGALSLDAARLDLSQGLTQANSVTLQARSGDIALTGATVAAQGQLKAQATGQLTLQQGKLLGQDVILSAATLDNRQGQVSATHSLAIDSTGALDNRSGTLLSGGALTLNAGPLDNSQGHIEGGQLSLATGDLANRAGTVIAQDTLQARVGTLDNSGTLYSGNSQSLQASGRIANSGVLAAQGSLAIQAAELQATSGSLLAAGLRSDGSLTGHAGLGITTTGAIALQGQALASGTFSAEGSTLNLSHGQASAADIALRSGAGVNAAQASIVASGGLDVQATGLLDNQGGVLSADHLHLASRGLDNRQGQVLHTGSANGSIDAGTGLLDNRTGRIGANATDLSLSAGTLLNQGGQIEHAGSGQLGVQVRGDLSLSAGLLSSNGTLSLDVGGTLDARGATTSARNLNLRSQSLDNQGGTLQVSGDLQLTTGRLDNQQGLISAGRDLGVDVAGRLDNSHGGAIVAGNSASVGGGQLDNSHGQVQATGGITLAAGTMTNEAGSVFAGAQLQGSFGSLDNNGTFYAGGAQSLRASGTIRNTAVIASLGDLSLAAGELQSSADSLLAGGLTAQGQLSGHAGMKLDATGQLTATGQNLAAGSLDIGGANVDLSHSQTSAGAITLRSADGINLGQAELRSAGSVKVQAGGLLDNRNATLAGQQLDLSVGSIDNRQGQILHLGTGAGQVQARGVVDNRDGQLGLNANDFRVSAGELRNQAGTIEHAGAGRLTLQTQGDLLAATGHITSNAAVQLNAGGAIDHQDAVLTAHGLTLAAARLDNRGGQINQLGTALSGLAVAGHIDNRGGVLQSNGSLALNAGSLANSQGLLTTTVDGTLQFSGAVDNSNGQLVAAGSLALGSAQLTNTQGVLQALAGTLQLDVGDADNQGGSVLAGGQLHGTFGTLNNSGSLYAGDSQQLNVGGLLRNSGVIAARDAVHIEAGELQSSSTSLLAAGMQADGTLAGHAALDVNTTDALAAQGQTLAAGSITLRGATLDLSHSQTSGTAVELQARSGNASTAQASVVSATQLGIHAAGPNHNHEGTLSAQQLGFELHGLDNRQGQILQSGNANLRIDTQGGVLDNSAGRIGVNAAQLNLAAGELRNQGGSIQHAGTDTLSIDTQGAWLGANGELLTRGDVRARAGGAVDHHGATLVAQNLDLQAQGLDNSDGHISLLGTGTAQLTLAQDLANDRGALQTNGSLTLSARQASNLQGQLTAAGDITATLQGTLDNSGGNLAAAHTITVQAGGLTNTHGNVQAVGGDLTLQLSGALGNTTGSLYAGGNAHTQAGSVDNRGSFYAAGEQQLEVTGRLHNDGTIAAQAGTTVTAGDIDGAGVFAAGLRTDGSLVGNASLSLSASGALAAQGTNLASAQASFQAGGSLSLAGSQTSAASISVHGASVDTSGAKVVSAGTLDIHSDGQLRNQGGTLSAAQLLLASTALDNHGGQLLQTGTTALRIDTQGGQIDNSAGRISTNATQLTLAAGGLNNEAGHIEHAGSGALTLQVNGDFKGQGGTITSNGSLAMQVAGQLDHRDATLVAQQVTLQAQDIDNQRGVIAQRGSGNTRLDAAGTFDNRGGAIQTAGTLQLNAQQLANAQGSITSLLDATVAVRGQLDNSQQGQIASGAALGVTADGIDNRQGQLSAGASLTLTAAQAVDNREGVIAAADALKLKAASLDNRSGQLAAVGGKLELDTTGAVQNQAGHIDAAQDITAKTGDLDNSQGRLYAGRALSLDAQVLNNTEGSLIAGAGLQLTVQSLDSTRGLVQSAGAATITAQTLVNTQSAGHPSGAGGIQSGDSLTIEATTLDNHQGMIGSAQTLQLRTDALDNTQGRIVALADLTATTHGIDNTQGQVQALGQITLDAGNGVLRNRGGLVRGAGHVELKAQSIDNSATLGADQGIEGTSITAHAATVTNTGGAMRADQDLSLNATTLIDNSNGLLSAGRTLALLDAGSGTLQLANSGGVAIAGQQLQIDAARVGFDGKLLSQGTAALTTHGDIHNTGDYIATGNATLSTDGSITNTGKLRATGTLTLQGTNIDNEAGAEIAGADTQLIASQDLTNRGLIDGHTTIIQAAGVNNLGSGRIYGDDLGIRAGTLVNGEAGSGATIAARNSLAIDAGSLTNNEHALIFSAGNLGITGGSLTNASATIEAMGDMSLDVGSILNRNNHFSTRFDDVGSSSSHVEYVLGGGDVERGHDLVNRHDQGEIALSDCEAQCATIVATSDKSDEWYRYTYTRTVKQTVIATSDPGHIVAGGNLSINGSLTNDRSEVIAGGTLSGLVGQNPNIDALGESHTIESGNVLHSWRHRHKGRDSSDTSTTAYNPPELIETIHLGAAKTLEHAATGGGRAIGSAGAATLGASTSAAGDAQSQLGAGAVVTIDTQADDVHAPTQGGAGATSGAQGTSSSHGTQAPGAVGAASGTQAQDAQGLNGTGSSQRIGSAATQGNADDATGNSAGTAHASGPANGSQLQPGTPSGHTAGQGSTAPGVQAVAGAAGAQAGTAPARSGATAGQAPQLGRITQVEQADGSNVHLVQTTQIDTRLPSASLFRSTPGADSHVLFETDPRFADRRTWLSSDTMLRQLGLDPATTQKRLGDGFYEQRLVREQVGQLTGQRFLGDYRDDEAQYAALLQAGSTFAQAHGLRVGVALSADQMAALTTDIVWLVERDVTQADGSTTRALVPQVYARTGNQDLSPGGALLAGRDVQLDLGKGNAQLSGNVFAKNTLGVQADNLQVGHAQLQGNTVAVAATNDLNVLASSLNARNGLSLEAGRDLGVQSATRDDAAGTHLDRLSTLYTANGPLVLRAGQDIRLAGAVLQQAGSGFTVVNAGRDLTLDTLQLSHSESLRWDANNTRSQTTRTDFGTQVQSAGPLVLQAGQDATLKAAQLHSDAALQVAAGRDLNLVAGRRQDLLDSTTRSKSDGFLHKSTTDTHVQIDQGQSLGSTLSGQTVQLQAARDLLAQGAQVVSDNGTRLQAGRDVTLQAGQNTLNQTRQDQTRGSGIYSAGIGVTVGSRTLDTTTQLQQTTAQVATVGAIQGDVQVLAGGRYTQSGTQVQTPAGNIDIKAQSVAITPMAQHMQNEQDTRFTQTGVTLALSAPGVQSGMSAMAAAKQAEQAEDPRLKALAGATAALKAIEAVKEVQKAMEEAQKAQDSKNSGIRLSLTVGTSQSHTHQTQTADTQAASGLTAGGLINLEATGAGKASNIDIQGSDLTAKNIRLKADNQVNLGAAQDTSSQQSKQDSVSASAGISIGVGKGSGSFGYSASASLARGNQDGSDTTQRNTHLTAGDTIQIQSGGDTTLSGAVVKANQVQADVGGDLKLKSLQDTATFASKNQSASVNVTVGFGASANLSLAQTKVGADYAAVNEQTGIQAGDGGFQVNVKGKTDLQGAVITSSQAAIDANRNTLTTQSLTTSDIENHSRFKAEAISVSVGTGGGSAGAFKKSGNDTSTTQSAISAGNVSFTGGDAAGSQATLAKLDRGAGGSATAGTLNKGWDGQKLGEQAQLGAQVVQSFGSAAAKEIGSAADRKREELKAQADQAGKQGDTKRAEELKQEAAKWDEGGAYRVAMHGALGAVTGGASGLGALQGAAGAVASAEAAPALNDLQKQLRGQLEKNGLDETSAKNIAKLVTGGLATAGGAVVGGTAGAVAAANEDFNNRQLHQIEAALIKRNAAAYAQKRGISVEQAEVLLTQQALRQIDSAWDTRFGPGDADASAFLRQLGAGTAYTDRATGQSATLFTATAEQRDNHAMFSQYATAPIVGSLYDKAANRANKPKGGQTIEAGLSGSQMALNDAARDNGHMKAQPVQVQMAVLGQLRQQRQDLGQEYAALQNELHGSLSAERRTTVMQRMGELEDKDQRLRQAVVMQILDMAQAGNISPAKQREWTEGFGAALGAARLGIGMRAPIGQRVDMFRGAAAETAAARQVAKDVQGARIDNNFNRDGAQYNVDEILAKPKGERPDPTTYLTPRQVDAHAREFSQGASNLVPNGAFQTYYKNQPSVYEAGGSFVSPSSEIDRLLQNAAGNIGKIETDLGIPAGQWATQGTLYRVDVRPPVAVKIPSGNERGANELWLPGGYTSGGKVEGIVTTTPSTQVNMGPAVSTPAPKGPVAPVIRMVPAPVVTPSPKQDQRKGG